MVDAIKVCLTYRVPTSSRAGKILKEDMEAMGPVRLRDVEEAQQYIVTAAKELSNNGEIVISEGKDSDELIY